MSLTCHNQPISFLRLERYLQGDGDPRERQRVAEHLHECDACRSCFESLQDEVIELLPLPATVTPLQPRVRRTRIWPPLTAALAIAATIALWARGTDISAPTLPPARVAIKGGELALELVRQHAGSVTADPKRFAAGDSFQLRVSCPPGPQVHWDVVVFQAGETFFPLTPNATLACANGVTLPGAFALDGAAPVDVCVVIAGDAVVDRARLGDAAQLRGLDAACVRVEASEGR